MGEEDSPLRIVTPGTDLLRHPAKLAPEFLESQSEHASNPIQGCTIYDAGSRAFDPRAYLEEVARYWIAVLTLASQGVTYKEYLTERFPIDPRLSQEIPDEWGDPAWLKEIAIQQIVRAHQK